MTFNEKLRRLTEDKKKTVLSIRCGLPRTAISDYCAKRCKPSCVTVLAISRVLGVDLEWLIDERQEWPPKHREPSDTTAQAVAA